MLNSKNAVWKTKSAQQFADVLADIPDVSVMKKFLRDVMTETEIIELGRRLEAAKLLQTGTKYTDVTKITKLSSRTVARISDWLQNGCNGYEVALQIINKHHGHTPPARAK